MALIDRIVQAARKGRSPLYRYFWDNFDALAPELDRPNWEAVAAELAAAGIRGGKGQAVTATVARQTWWRVKHDKAEALERKPEAARPTGKAPAPAPEPDPPQDAAAEAEEKAPRFGTFRLRRPGGQEGE